MGLALAAYPGFASALERLRLTAADGAMLAALASHQGRQELFLRRRPEALGALRTVALVESSESSNRLEVPRAEKRQLVREACLRQLVPFPVSSIEQECPGISRELIRQVLQHLANEGRMQLEGRGRASRWVPLMGLAPGGKDEVRSDPGGS